MKLRVGALVLVGLFAIPAVAALTSPPQVTVAFSPSSVATNQPSTMTITITNPNTSPLTGASMIDSINSGLLLLAPATTNCPGSSVFSNSAMLSFGGMVPAQSSCTITALVTAAAPGDYQNSPGALFSNGPPSFPTNFAFLHVSAPVPAISTAGLIALALAFAAIGFVVLARTYT